MAEQLAILQKQRARAKGNVKRIQNLINEEMSAAELECRLGLVEAYFKQLLSVQLDIEQLNPLDEGQTDSEELCIITKAKIIQCLGDNYKRSHLEASMAVPFANISKLPALDLPKFDGKYTAYKNFISSFKQFVDNDSSLSSIEKFNHLIHCLSGQALDTVRAFQVTADNYKKALNRLNERYNNTTLIFLEHIANLYDLPEVREPSAVKLRSLVDNSSAIYSSLKSLGSTEDICNAMIIHLLLQKVDSESQSKWKETIDFGNLPTWETFSKHLERRCHFLEATVSHPSKSNPSRHRKDSRTSLHTQQKSCAYCKCTDHWINSCNSFKAIDVAARFNIVKKLGVCLNCLYEGHGVAKCTSKYKCKICKKSHHTLLHRPTDINAPLSSATEPSNATASSSNAAADYKVTVNAHMDNASTSTILATAVILVQDSSGEFQLGRALLDSGSQVNLIHEQFANLLNLPRCKTNINLLGVGGSSSKIKFEAQTVVRSRFSNFEFDINLLITKRLTGYQPEADIDITEWQLPSSIELADEYFHKAQPIDMILGAESFFDILSSGQIRLGPNLPTCQNTMFGWVVAGRYKVSKNLNVLQCSIANKADEDLNRQLEYLWSIEEVNISTKKYTDEQQACESSFISNVETQNDGRIIVKLPLNEQPDVLGSSYGTALKRFSYLEKRLAKDANLKSQYVQFMREYEQLGHMSRVKQPNMNIPHYFIPHHCVLKPTSTSTKLRVVFDASASTSTNKSLNDILQTGPTIQDELYLQVLRFRLYRYALSGDITKMYRMILVHSSHRPLQQIVWRESEDQEVSVYQLNTVTYGMSASPFLAIRSLHFLADQWQQTFPSGAFVVKNHFYVDDMLTGTNDVKQLFTINHEVKQLLKKGGFELTKIQSNYPALNTADNNKNLNLDEPYTTQALGINWEPQTDFFKFSFQPKKDYVTTTKRSILSLAASIFDPLGIVCPIVIQPRVLLQDLWINKIDWDSEVPQMYQTAFKNFVGDLHNMQSLRNPRYILASNSTNIQLHGFCDASNRAYGCCFYARVSDDKGNVYVNLLTAKCRVAPTKKRSLPQLELCGAHLLSKLYAKIIYIFDEIEHEVYLWTDAVTILRWLQMHSSTLVTFVGNRVSQIQEETANCTWRHVPTQSNPADIVSRGCSVTELSQSIWFTGPGFLVNPPEDWPSKNLENYDSNDVDSALRKSTFTCEIKANALLDMVERTSSYNKILRITSLLFRFRRLCIKTPPQDNLPITPDETRTALVCIIWNIQQQQFANVFQCIERGIDIRNSLRTLSLFIENVNNFPLLRVGGRLDNADMPHDRKHPFLMPKNNHFVNCFVRHLHVSNYHAGANALVAFIRQTFWVIGARTIARRIVRSCVNCVRYRPRLLQQLMGIAPAERVTQGAPFERCGVDFCGPINTYLKIRGKRPYKCYVAIFVCFVTKAVHIEAVSDLSSDAFIAALKRLIGRRGLPSLIFCDNATNFCGANSKLAELKAAFTKQSYQNDISNFCLTKQISFNFIPPRAPHFGGLWEAAVKSAKGHLYRSLADAKLSFEELTTALVEIEAVMNSRPISPVSTDPNDLEALTPGHLLIGRPLNSIPEPTIECEEISYLDRWKRITAVKQQFWKQWSTEYLNEMIQRTRWTSNNANLAIGDMVLIHEDNVPPLKWSTGRIEATVMGKDGKVRVADVRTSRGTYRRPIHKLALLPLS